MTEISNNDGGTPDCPVCNSPMVIRTARKGPNAGEEFWACTEFRNGCRGTRSIEPVGNQQQEIRSHPITKGTKLPVVWTDHVRREGWISEYTNVGAFPGFAHEFIENADEELVRCFSQCVVFSSRQKHRVTNDDEYALGTLITKLLQRGRAPLPTLGVEFSALENNSLGNWLVELPSSDPEIGFEISSGFNCRLTRNALVQAYSERLSFSLDNEFHSKRRLEIPLFDSENEERFLTEWVPQELGPTAGHWFIPQASLDRLLESHGFFEDGARRVDFLFVFPGAQPLVIEIDGPEHQDDPDVDTSRDEKLELAGCKIIRVENEEVRNGSGPNLNAIRAHCAHFFKEPIQLTANEQCLVDAVRSCSTAAKLQFCVARAIQYGWLTGQEWRLDIDGCDGIGVVAVQDLLKLYSAFDRLYGKSVSPSRVAICSNGSQQFLTKTADLNWEICAAVTDTLESASALSISIELQSSFYQTVDKNLAHGRSDFIVRATYLPLDLAAENSSLVDRQLIGSTDIDGRIEALTVFLQQIYRKRAFRPLQAEAIVNALNQIDSVVLLPTGAGKSIIYQLAGLLMPGVTIVIDPIIALIEDQVEGLSQYGIDRAAAITSAMSSAEDGERLLRRIERGEYYFILLSPERLQNPAFRSTLRALAETSVVNLAVVDEAHCVSEWGHDFRPAYLNLGRNIRTFARDRNGSAPPIIALTGTASRAVLRDLLADLNIDRSKSEALVRPETFDRPELHFSITRAGQKSEDVKAALRGTLNGLPSKFGQPRAEFFSPVGRDTASGIVFVPFVNAWSHGVMGTLSDVRSATGARVTNFSGGAPRGLNRNDWEVKKRENVKRFKKNQDPILVSTKAFGMGIDKPNIRYTVHMGVPGSLEAFYQEAGRAGRDRKPAHCSIVFSEFDPQRTDLLLDPSLDLAEVRLSFERVQKNRKQGDDITRILWFHLNSFSGQSQELESIEKILDTIASLDKMDTFDMPFWSGENDEKTTQEKAIFRLVKIGILSDYEVMFGSQVFRLYVSAFNLEKCKNSILDYVESAQPGLVKLVTDSLNEIVDGNQKNCALQLAKILIGFTYDVIEKSRRRAIQEAVLLARNAKNDKEIRQRLLDYLQEGVGAESLANLLELTEVRMEPWLEMMENILTPIEAGEIRGLAIRALESYPDHPGVLILRSVSEMMCSDANDITASQTLLAAFRSSKERYKLSDNDITGTLTWLGDFVVSRSKKLGLPLAHAFYQAKAHGHLSRSVANHGMLVINTLSDRNIDAVKHVAFLSEAANGLETATQLVRKVFSDISSLETVGFDR